MTAFTANALEHKHDPNYVFPDGVRLRDAMDAIAAAGLAGNYVLAGQLKILYALDVCSRCGRQQAYGYRSAASLHEYGIDAFGSICSVCELEFLAMGRRKRSERHGIYQK